MRFLFLSAAFKPKLEKVQEWREFFRRTRTYYLSNLEERPFDIPYIIAARFLEKRHTLINLYIEDAFLLAVTDLTLEKPEPSTICDVVDELLEKHGVADADFTVNLDCLPDRYRKYGEGMPKTKFGMYEFRR